MNCTKPTENPFKWHELIAHDKSNELSDIFKSHEAQVVKSEWESAGHDKGKIT